MILQKLKHSADDIYDPDEEEVILTHCVNEINNGGEFTICGRAIPDSNLDAEGWTAVGESFVGKIKDCDCKDCLRIINYFKLLK